MGTEEEKNIYRRYIIFKIKIRPYYVCICILFYIYTFYKKILKFVRNAILNASIAFNMAIKSRSKNYRN